MSNRTVNRWPFLKRISNSASDKIMSALGILAILKSLGIEMYFIKYEELQGNV